MEYDLIFIGINRIPAPSGEITSLPVGDGLELVECHKNCAVWGTRGYIITYEGAQKMLKHAYPIQTQIDALLSLVARYDKSFRLFWTNEDIALGPALLAIVADINYSKVQDHCLKCHLPNDNIVYLTAIPGFLIILGLFLAVHCRSTRNANGVALDPAFPPKGGVVSSGKTDDLASSPTLTCGTSSKLDDRHDLVQVQVQPAFVPQGGGGHRRTGSRDCEAMTYHRRTGSRDCEAMAAAAFALHRRAGSRDSQDAMGLLAPEAAWSAEAGAAASPC